MAYVTTDRSGVPISSSAPSVIGPSGGYSSGGPVSDSGSSPSVAIAQQVANALTSSDGDFQQHVRSLLDYSESNSAFNASEAAKSRSWNAEQNQLAMAASAAEAQKNRDWQEMMSNTSHQRAVRDLVAAGLNPVLAASTGASTPSGSAGSGFASGGSSASADTSGAALGNILASLINTSAQAALQEQLYTYQSDLQSKQLATEVLKSENSVLSSRISADGHVAAAGTSAAAQNRYTDAMQDMQQASHEHEILLAAIEHGYDVENLERKYGYDYGLKKLENSGRVDVAKIGTQNTLYGNLNRLAEIAIDGLRKNTRYVDPTDRSTWPASYY